MASKYFPLKRNFNWGNKLLSASTKSGEYSGSFNAVSSFCAKIVLCSCYQTVHHHTAGTNLILICNISPEYIIILCACGVCGRGVFRVNILRAVDASSRSIHKTLKYLCQKERNYCEFEQFSKFSSRSHKGLLHLKISVESYKNRN